MLKFDSQQENNPFAPLYTINYSREWVNIPNSKLGLSVRKEAAVIYEALFGIPQNPDDHTITVKADDRGELVRIYSPSVGTNETGSQLLVKWGEKSTPLKLDGTNIIPPALNENSLTDEVKFDTLRIDSVNLGYKDPELAVSVILDAGTEYLGINLPLRFKDIKNKPSLSEFKSKLKQDPEGAFSLLADVTSSGNNDSILSVTDLPLGTPLEISGFEDIEFTTKKGVVMQKTLLLNGEGKKYWSPDLLDKIIHLFPEGGTLTVNEVAVSGSNTKYIQLGVFDSADRTSTVVLGSGVKAQLDKQLIEGDYTVWGVDSFMVNSKGKQFRSFLYTLQNDKGGFFKAFAPSKHRTVLIQNPVINRENPASFVVFKSGVNDPNSFSVSNLKANCQSNGDLVDISDLDFF